MKNKRINYKHGGSHDGNALARREEKRIKKGKTDRKEGRRKEETRK